MRDCKRSIVRIDIKKLRFRVSRAVEVAKISGQVGVKCGGNLVGCFIADSGQYERQKLAPNHCAQIVPSVYGSTPLKARRTQN